MIIRRPRATAFETRARSLAAPSLALLLGVALSTPVQAADPAARPDAGARHFDARGDYNKGFRIRPAAAQQNAVAAFARTTGVARSPEDLSVLWDEHTGALRSLSHHNGFLSHETGLAADIARSKGAAAEPAALDFVRANVGVLGLTSEDLNNARVTDRVYSDVTGTTNLYYQQRWAGLGVYNGQLQVNVHADGRILGVNNAFMPRASRAAGAATPRISFADAVRRAMSHAGRDLAAAPEVLDVQKGAERLTRVKHDGVSLEPIVGKLMWLPLRAGQLRLVWNFNVATLDGEHWWDFTVDAQSGKVWTRFDWVATDSYKVYPMPAESPNHVSTLPPADGRSLLTNPANATASPFGWHDTNGAAGADFTTTQGNNAHAYTDTDANNSPDTGSSPSGGAGLAFDFAMDLTQAPSTYRPAAVTNLFYWSNIIHDVQYQYGFNEAGGNFQQNNYGKGGTGNDYVLSEAQDGSGTNNANFATPPDGSRPRMQMYTWTAPTPDRDGDFDASIVIHEYGHGISNRLIGGPSNTSCMTNNQQPGEGTSDWWALVYTHRPGDTGATPRGIGTYALNQPTNGLGIRTQRYSTDPAVNTWTYASMNGMAIPHGVGSIWAQGAWEVYWALVDHWGWDPNLYNANGSAGNQRAMLYINQGLKNSACNPTFTQVRDGIIQAATALHGGEDVCRIWTAFAAYGLGTNAVAGTGTSPTNGFNVPASCSGVNQPPVANAGPDQSVATGAVVTLNGSGSSDPDGGPNPLTYSWSKLSGPAATLSSTTVAQPTFTASTAGTYVFQLQVSDGAASATDTVSVSAGTGIAAYDSALGAPKCGTVGNLCDSGTLLNGRASLGPEPNQPNTLGTCTDGTSGSYHGDESNDKVRVVSVDGTDFAAGKQVRVEATVWAYSSFSSDKLDLYYAANANSPTWTLIGTLSPTVGGAQTLSATYTLPTGSLQAVRARFRYQGSAAACGTGSYDDHDDLVFAVGAGSTDTTAPTTSLTAPAAGTISGTVTVSANASDNVGVSRVDFLHGTTVIGSDTTSPYSVSWNTTTVANGSYSLTAKAYDAAGNVGTSSAVAVTVSNTSSELITNGGFDTTTTPWVVATRWTRATSGGQSGAYMQSANVNSISTSNTLYQQFAIPTSATGTGTFYTYITTGETTTSTVYDRLYVEVRNTSGTLLATLATYSNLNKSTGWVQRSVNLSAYKGQTVRLQFRVTSDSSLPTVFRVDTVSVK